MVLGKLDSYMERLEVKTSSHTYTKINSKWIKDLNVRQEAIKLLKKNKGITPFDINHSNIFGSVSRQREKKAKIKKWDLILKAH